MNVTQFSLLLTLLCQFLIARGDGKEDFLVQPTTVKHHFEVSNKEEGVGNVSSSDSSVTPPTPMKKVKKYRVKANNKIVKSVTKDKLKFVSQSPLKRLLELKDSIVYNLQNHAVESRTGMLLFGIMSMLEAATLATVAFAGLGGVLLAPAMIAGLVFMVYAM